MHVLYCRFHLSYQTLDVSKYVVAEVFGEKEKCINGQVRP